MPSKKSRTTATRSSSRTRQSGRLQTSIPQSAAASDHIAFWPLIVLCLIVWVVYRSVFHFEVWFDEVVGKAIFFGFPVWLYVSLTQSRAIGDTFAPPKLYSGLMQGIALGGVYGFVTSILAFLLNRVEPQAALLFTSSQFWWEFFLALMTGFWETVFFFSWVMVAIQEKYREWSLLKQVLVVMVVFVVFHLPNTLLRFSGAQVFVQIGLLSLFAVGQALLFTGRRNGYALALSHAIWGMVLLVHLG